MLYDIKNLTKLPSSAGRHCQMNFSNVNNRILIRISPRFVLHGTSRHLIQCWPRFATPYVITTPQWVKVFSRTVHIGLFIANADINNWKGQGKYFYIAITLKAFGQDKVKDINTGLWNIYRFWINVKEAHAIQGIFLSGNGATVLSFYVGDFFEYLNPTFACFDRHIMCTYNLHAIL